MTGSNKIASIISSAHEGVIFNVAITEDGSLVSGGGRDGLIKTWDLASKSETGSQQVITSIDLY